VHLRGHPSRTGRLALTVGAELTIEQDMDQVAKELGEELKSSAASYNVPLEVRRPARRPGDGDRCGWQTR